MFTYRHTEQILEEMDKAKVYDKEKTGQYREYIGYLLFHHHPQHPVEVTVKNIARRLIAAGKDPNELVLSIAFELNNNRTFERFVEGKAHPKAYLNIEIKNTLENFENGDTGSVRKYYERVSPLVMKKTKSGRFTGTMLDYAEETMPAPPPVKTEEQENEERLMFFLGGLQS